MGLVLGRSGGESVILRSELVGDLVVTVLPGRAGRKSVRLRIEAPDDVFILRRAADGSIQTGNGSSRQVAECNL